jgi:hypothetical protein
MTSDESVGACYEHPGFRSVTVALQVRHRQVRHRQSDAGKSNTALDGAPASSQAGVGRAFIS